MRLKWSTWHCASKQAVVCYCKATGNWQAGLQLATVTGLVYDVLCCRKCFVLQALIELPVLTVEPGIFMS